MRRVALVGAWLLGACEPELPAELGDCPEDSTVGWAEASAVFEANCTRCHHSELEGDDRNGAEELVNFDTREAASQNDFLVWSMIWPERMPPDADPMSEDEAWIVWEWLSCGGPE